MTIETSRARTLAVFGSVRIGEYVVPAGAPRPPFAGPRDGVGLHIVRSGEIAIDTKRVATSSVPGMSMSRSSSRR